MLNRSICLILGYFVGAIIQTGFWIGKFNHIDIRDYGSGNAGTTNTMRTLGKKAGMLTYFMDAFKSCLVAIIIHFIYGNNSGVSEMLLILYGGFGVVLGHNFPFYMQFKGGKGIAASGGMIVGLWDWRLVVILLAAFIISVVVTRYVSVGSLTIMIGFFILYTIFAIHGDYNFTSNAKMIEGIVLAGVIAGMAVIRHLPNIKRLIAGTENKLSFGSKTA